MFGDSKDPLPHVTCVTWSQHGFFYIGTDAGTVKTLTVQEKTSTETNVAKYELMWSSESFPPERYVAKTYDLHTSYSVSMKKHFS